MNTHNRLKSLLLTGLALIVLSLTACNLLTQGTVQTGPLQTQSESVELGSAAFADVEIAMGAGELTVSGGAADLMEADFTFNVDEWAPEVTYSVSGDNGSLLVAQPATDFPGIPGGDIRYEWDLRFNEDIPLNMQIDLGGGTSSIDLSALTVQDLTMDTGAGDVSVKIGGSPLTSAVIETGVGQMTIDLAGKWTADAAISVDAGVGDLTVIIPSDVGAIVEADLGVGNISADGFRVQGDAYTNDAYGESPVTLRVDVSGGAGQVTLSLGE